MTFSARLPAAKFPPHRIIRLIAQDGFEPGQVDGARP